MHSVIIQSFLKRKTANWQIFSSATFYFVILFLPKERVTSSVNEVTLSLDLTFIRQWLLHQCLIQTIVMEKLNLVRCSLGQLLSRF